MKKEKLIPAYAILPLSMCVLLNFLVYFGSKPLISQRVHMDISTRLDQMIPFVPVMILPYVLSYVFWIVGYIMIARESREVCYRVCGAEMIAKVICLIFFIAMPCTLVRPEIPDGGNIFLRLTDFIYRCDSPENLFPSIHCLESWFCFRGALYCRKPGKTYKAIAFICAMLIFLSTVMVKQHVAADMFGAVAAAEIGLFLSEKLMKTEKGQKLLKK